MSRALVITMTSLLLFLVAAPAYAQEAATGFGEQSGQVIVSGDRLMGLFDYTSTKITNNNVNPSTSDSATYSSFALLANPAGSTVFVGGNANVVAPYNIPRFSIDVTVIPRLTLGGSVILFFTPGASGTHCDGGVCTTADTTSLTVWGIAPRIGYIIGFSNLFSFWPRGGFSFYSENATTPTNQGRPNPGSDSLTLTQFMINVEAPFVLTPVPHFGITAGPVIDIPVAGAVKSSTTQNGVTVSNPGEDVQLFHIGIMLGLLGWI